MVPMETYTVYILRTSSNTLYIGQTKNIEKRMKEHAEKSGRGSKYMRAFSSFELVYTEQYTSRSEALKRELELKKLKREGKDRVIQNWENKVINPD
jgi:putative endonuclease